METKKVTQEMREALRKPLPSEAITQHPTKTYLSSIKAIYVTERLNDVFGVGSWKLKSDKESVANGFVIAKTTLEIQEYGIYLESFGGNDNGGEKNKNFDLGDAYKGATTDGLTKICSYLEIGIDVFKGKVNNYASKPKAQAETPKPIPETPKPTQAPAKIVLTQQSPNFDSIKLKLANVDITMQDVERHYTLSEEIKTALTK